MKIMKIMKIYNSLITEFPMSQFRAYAHCIRILDDLYNGYDVDYNDIYNHSPIVFGIPKYMPEQKLFFDIKLGCIITRERYFDYMPNSQLSVEVITRNYEILYLNMSTKIFEKGTGCIKYITPGNKDSMNDIVLREIFRSIFLYHQTMNTVFNPILYADNAIGYDYYRDRCLGMIDNFEGKSINDFADKFTSPGTIPIRFGISGFISKINVEFCKIRGSNNKSFDYIDIECLLVGTAVEDRIEFFKIHKNRIMKAILFAIQNTGTGKKLNIQASDLKTTDLIFTVDNRLFLKVEMKKVEV